MRLFTTVRHTATQYTMQHHEQKTRHIHCGHPALHELIELHDGDLDLVTTYRDPYRVGASWVNRYWRSADQFLRELRPQWFGEWEDYGEILAMGPEIYYVDDFDKPKVKSKGDAHKVHLALDQGDYQHFHSFVPPEWIRFAVQRSQEARRARAA